MGNFQLDGPFFFDGAFGTYYNLKSKKNVYCEYANLNDRDAVLKIHREYIQTGANAIKTNTFGANFLLSDDPDKISAIIQSGYEIAMNAAARTNVQVFADIGTIHPETEDASEEYKNIARQFIACGATHFIFETLAEFEAIVPALAFIKEKVPESVILVSFAVSQDGYTSSGYYYKNIIKSAAQNEHTDIVGLNCLCGPSHMYTLLQNMHLPQKPVSAMPNSGYPSSLNGRTVYQDNTDYFSAKLAGIHSLGVSVLGGCCGTTPAHIRETIERIKGQKGVVHASVTWRAPRAQKKETGNRLKECMESGKKIIAVELDAPVSPDCAFLIESARKVGALGADLITIADSPLARARADSIMVAAKVKRDTGMNVLPHLCCRDRNHIGIKAALIAGKIEDIDNIFVITGDPIAQADRSEFKSVFNFNSVGLISFIRHLNEEIFLDSPYYIGGAIDPNAVQFENELSRARQKIENGASFLLTQPLFTGRGADNLKLAKKELGCRILAGILPIAGYKNALFLNNEVSGIQIPQELIERLKDKNKDEIYKISLDFCMDIVKLTYGSCDGYYIMTPLRKADLVCSLIKLIRSQEK